MTNQRQDIIGLFAQHKVAANLLMLIMVMAGLLSLTRLNTQFFPTFALDIITVSVTWRGASAEDIEDAISSRVEQELRTIDFVDKMTSTSSYGSSLVMLEFVEGTDMGKVLDQVKDRIAQLRNLPSDSEIPKVSLVTPYEDVARMLITTESDDLNELRYLAHQIEHDLLDRGISRITISGLPEEEISIQLSAKKLESLGLSLGDVSQRIGELSLDLPAGEIGNADTARQLRSLGQRRDAQAFSQLPLKSDYSGQLLLLDDVANIERRPLRKQVSLFYQGKPAIEISLKRTDNADSLESARILDSWLEDNQYQLPKGVEIKVYDASWELIEGRMNLLLKNGLGGLVLVVGILFLFLQGRVAIWVAVGIPVSFMATLFIMYLLGGTINMISLFALIMALGIIVDDAIVVGEDALSHYQSGEHSLEAAEGGARRMFAPVISSSLTTIASFLPLMMIGGVIGNILFDIPFVVICVIVASVFESFLILPSHLRHAFHKIHHVKPPPFRNWLDQRFNYLRDELFKPVVTAAVKNRWITISSTLGLFIICIGLLAGGRLNFTFFPTSEGTSITANARFTAGTPSYKVAAFLEHLNSALDKTKQDLGPEIVRVAVTRLGEASSVGGDARANERFGSISLELVSPDARDIRNKDFIQVWQQHVTLPAGIETFTISERRGGPPGSDIDIRLTGASAETLKEAALEVAQTLKQFKGVNAIENDMPYGQEQLIYSVNGRGNTLGLTVNNVGRQLRAAFDGQLVQIFQDGDDEVEVRVMLPDSERNTSATLENFMLRLPNGGSTPLSSVVEFKSQRGFDVLRHTDSKLAIHITATVDPTVNNSNKIIANLQQNLLPDLISHYAVNVDFEGRAEEQAETMSDMLQGVVLAFVLIYLVLAWVFSSYGWPLVVMAAIPFGLIGALSGHWFMGIDLTILSLFGIFGLSGIVVNDSIILVTFFKQQREQGVETTQAIINAATQRLRAVLLTSLTTIAGLTPLLFETSRQAQFLIPMAVSISFGLMFATVLVLLVIPALLSVHESIADKLVNRNA